jgi:hypothetical protein
MQNITNITQGYQLLTYVNEVSQGWFGTAALVGILIVAIISMYSRDGDFSAAFVVGCFITTILSILFKIIGIITDAVLFMFILATVGGFAYLWFKK